MWLLKCSLCTRVRLTNVQQETPSCSFPSGQQLMDSFLIKVQKHGEYPIITFSNSHLSLSVSCLYCFPPPLFFSWTYCEYIYILLPFILYTCHVFSMENLQSEPFQEAFPKCFIWALLECEATPRSTKMGLPWHNFQIKIWSDYLGKKKRWNLMVIHNQKVFRAEFLK